MNLNFAENFKKLRKEKGLTQEKIAEELGVSGQSVSRWEIGVCYPDLELLPSIANYFDVTVDSLLSNDRDAKEKEREHFLEAINSIPHGESLIDFVSEYCRKYPNDCFYASQLVESIAFYVVGDKEKTEKYASLLYKNAEKLLDTSYRNVVITLMSAICDESELKKWLDMAPYARFSRRYCLNNRASLRNNWKGTHIQNGLEIFENFADLLDRRCPDSLGAEVKSEFQQDVMATVRSFGGGNVPDGWKLFYAYKELVYAACLFGKGDMDTGWEHFDSAIEKCKYVFSLEDEWLDIGGALFSGLKVDKPWCWAIDEDGNRHKLFAMHRHSFYNMDYVHSLLTDPKWAWFNYVRDTEKYRDAVAWVKSVSDKQQSEME